MSGEAILSAPIKEPVCGCLNLLRVEMRTTNGTPGLHRPTGAAMIYMRRVDPAGPLPPMVMASFCPFCGDAYR